eukprot:8687060-Lingulodinium_polyedra.AAC.1
MGRPGDQRVGLCLPAPGGGDHERFAGHEGRSLPEGRPRSIRLLGQAVCQHRHSGGVPAARFLGPHPS